MKVEWVSRLVEGHSIIKRDSTVFGRVSLGMVENARSRNPYMYPRHISLIFFMNDQRAPKWKVVLFHEPRCRSW